MRALTFQGPRDVRVETVPDPRIERPTDAIVRITSTAICGSDLHVWHGREVGLDAGTILGHELAGEIVEIGRDVRRFRPGERVTSPFSTSCGTCFFCKEALQARCSEGAVYGWVERGIGLQGVQAEYARVPLADATLVAHDPAIPSDHALFAGDVLATGFFCAESAEVGPGRTAVVIGCGPVGLLAIHAARRLGAEQVLAIDSVPERLTLAAQLGATTVDREREDPIERVRAETGGRGADSILEAVGSPGATRLAVDVARPGATIAAVGVHTEAAFSFRPGEAYDKNLTYRAGRCPARRYAERLLADWPQWKDAVESIISHRLSLSDGPRGYDIFDRKLERCTKVVLRP